MCVCVNSFFFFFSLQTLVRGTAAWCDTSSLAVVTVGLEDERKESAGLWRGENQLPSGTFASENPECGWQKRLTFAFDRSLRHPCFWEICTVGAVRKEVCSRLRILRHRILPRSAVWCMTFRGYIRSLSLTFFLLLKFKYALLAWQIKKQQYFKWCMISTLSSNL